MVVHAIEERVVAERRGELEAVGQTQLVLEEAVHAGDGLLLIEGAVRDEGRVVAAAQPVVALHLDVDPDEQAVRKPDVLVPVLVLHAGPAEQAIELGAGAAGRRAGRGALAREGQPVREVPPAEVPRRGGLVLLAVAAPIAQAHRELIDALPGVVEHVSVARLRAVLRDLARSDRGFYDVFGG